MDLDAVLARRPQVALVDELAHTNVPGSAHEKRWQDVERCSRPASTSSAPSTSSTWNRSTTSSRPSPACRNARRCRLGRARRRAGRARRHDARGAAPANGAREHLHAGQGRRRAGELLPPRQPHRAARAGPALARRQRRRGAAALPRTARHRRDLGDPGARRRRAHRRPRGGDADAPGAPGSPPGPPAARCWPSTSPAATGWPAPSIAALASQRLLVESLGGSYHSVVGDDVPDGDAGLRPRATTPPRSCSAPAAATRCWPH